MPAFDVDIEAISANGDGIASVAGRRLFVPFTIPGERVRVFVRPGRDEAAAVLVSVLRASPHRVTPRCRHFGPEAVPAGKSGGDGRPQPAPATPAKGYGPCGGCSWQHIAYPEQLRLKTGLVDTLVRQYLRTAPQAKPMLPGTRPDDPWAYRQKVHFVFSSQTAPGKSTSTLTMGHYVRGSRRVIPVSECPVHDARGNALAFHIRDHYIRNRVSAADDRAARVLAALAIRSGHNTTEQMATVIVTNGSDKRLRTATRELMASEPEVSFHLNLHPERDAYIFGRDTRRLSGPERMRDTVGGVSFLISPTAFFQTNVAAAEVLVQLVLAAVPAKSRVLDLYAGAGLFALPLAKAGHTVLAVEENRAAVADGEASARLNRIDSRACRFVAQRAEAVESVASTPDVVVLDPPREGCTAAVIDAVFGRLRPKRGIYVSCNPESLAPELAEIAGYGYRIESLQPVDMFPHTAHIETVAIVTR